MVLTLRCYGRWLALTLLFWSGYAAPGANEGFAAEDPAFAIWVKELEADARAAGISEKTIEQALGGLAPVPEVVELDRKQPETRQTSNNIAIVFCRKAG